MKRPAPIAAILSALICATAWSSSVLIDTGSPDGKMAAASRPSPAGGIEIEAADDFLVPCATTIESATFTGLVPADATAEEVVVEIYRVFPQDSDSIRTPAVPTRANSPSDTAFASRDSAAAGLTFTTTVLNASYTASNSVLNGINKSPNQTTGGEGPVTGTEVEFDVAFSSGITLPAGHYFFVPQVRLNTGDFFWLSAAHPVASFTPDLQTWIRNENLAPDWLRIGTDIVGGNPAPAFNGSFSLTGTSTPLAVSSSAGNPIAVVPGTAIAPVTFSASGATPPLTFSETGALPGLSLDSSTGVLSGTPNAIGTFPVTITATDALGCSGDLALTIRVETRPTVPAVGGTGLALLALALSAAGALALRR